MPGRAPTLARRFDLDKAAEPMDVYDLRAPRPRGALPLKPIYTYLIHTGSPLSFRKDRHNIRDRQTFSAVRSHEFHGIGSAFPNFYVNLAQHYGGMESFRKRNRSFRYKL